MNKILATSALAVVLGLVPVLSTAAQEAEAPSKPEPPAEAPGKERPPVPLRVQVTIARFEGERKVASMPYTLVVSPSRTSRASIRMGIEVPVRVGAATDKDGKPTSWSHQYRNVGTNIDCRALPRTPGDQYGIELQVEQSSVNPGGEKLPAVANDLPFFRTFNTSFTALLRDGQTATHIVATDPVTGESVRIDVTLNVVR